MKTRTILATAALSGICLLAGIGAAKSEHRHRGGISVMLAAWTNARSPRKFHYRWEEWQGDARQVAAIFRYLLAPEVPDLDHQLMASNNIKADPLGHACWTPRVPLTDCGSFLASADDVVVTPCAEGKVSSQKLLLLQLPRSSGHEFLAVSFQSATRYKVCRFTASELI